VDDPGEELYEWESEMATIDDELHESPADALPELDHLVRRMLDHTGYELSDPVVRQGDEREVVAEYLAAHDITTAVERGSDDITSGDVASAINGFRAIYDFLVAERGSVDADFADADD
jgi:hypothetical protein